MKRFPFLRYVALLVVLMLVDGLPVAAQQNKNEDVSGRIIDNSTAEPLPNTTLQLYEITT
jgi:hypothetical protein